MAEWLIVVVDTIKKPWPSAARLVSEVGTPPSIAAKYAVVRRELSPAGLKRKLKVLKN